MFPFLSLNLYINLSIQFYQHTFPFRDKSAEMLKEKDNFETNRNKQRFVCKSEIRKEIWSPPSISDYSGKVDVNITYSFEDPKTYKGPVVQGWEPGKK